MPGDEAAGCGRSLCDQGVEEVSPGCKYSGGQECHEGVFGGQVELRAAEQPGEQAQVAAPEVQADDRQYGEGCGEGRAVSCHEEEERGGKGGEERHDGQ